MGDNNRPFLFIPQNFLNLPTTIKQGSTVKATYTYFADGTKIKAVNAYNGGSDYVGSFKYNRNGSNITLESVATAGGRTYKTSGGYEARYFVTDHLGSTRLIAYPNGNVIEQNDYMPYGERHSNSSLATSGNPFLYNGKESQKSFGINYIDSEARFQRLDGAFNSIDPLCEEYYHISPYTYCAANPINLIDPNGMDWYSYLVKDYDNDGNVIGQHVEYAYTKYKSQQELDEAGIEGTYQGEVVVIFDGRLDEKLGTKNGDPKGLYIDGEDAITAIVTVYGCKGSNDIGYYTGFTMSSDFNKYGAIANGEYHVNYIENGKKPPLASNYAVNNKGPVDCLNGINPSPINPYSSTQKNAIYIHATNVNGKAGGNIAASTGCLLIQGGTQWNNFKAQIGARDFKLILNRR